MEVQTLGQIKDRFLFAKLQKQKCAKNWYLGLKFFFFVKAWHNCIFISIYSQELGI